ncbi:hypothetical protein [Paenibacillus mucilaginosus]|uniref:Uncharacterized protein n=2 Tax=Paenibacillus mucilaginosus TaxID=61624 RepID=I0BTA1_9BACL|nr:hypothetical protein [Paenibacillus mucilaginosus]AEI45592.1 hypothetical protein KNP414_07082 [Paenibacillus mucilaginosus KNP414]AFH65598.1 hypothetical protein B2K_33705 [Paenibacillus mucilaginosus K02]MCG7215339.1 hypothetical protein [Paenibacillus mucilaginosus]WDM27001.1 hypothetical protein KCX80_32135 [Paenibacillus mucilaginosus]
MNGRQQSQAEVSVPLGLQEQRMTGTLRIGQRPLYRGSYTVSSAGR